LGALVFGLFARGTIQDWARDEEDIKTTSTEDNPWHKDFTSLATINRKEDNDSQNEGKANDYSSVL
jgi:hypothetical protein